jgi:hypothetical protein
MPEHGFVPWGWPGIIADRRGGAGPGPANQDFTESEQELPDVPMEERGFSQRCD